MSCMLGVVAAIVFAIQAIRARSLLTSALWLTGVSAAVSTAFYVLGAYQVAVIELSVGAGLVTVLFVFAIGIAGDEAMNTKSLLPKTLIWGLVILLVLILGWLTFPMVPIEQAASSKLPFASVLWQQRGLDVLIQVVLIFAGVLGLLGLLAEAKAPLERPVAEQVVARRDQELLVLQQQLLDREESA